MKRSPSRADILGVLLSKAPTHPGEGKRILYRDPLPWAWNWPLIGLRLRLSERKLQEDLQG